MSEKKTNEEIQAYNDQLAKDAKELNAIEDVSAQVIETEVTPIPNDVLDAIAKLRKELEGDKKPEKLESDGKPKKVGRLDDVINDFHNEAGEEDAE